MSDCKPDCRCGEGEPAADPIVWNEVGWEWNGRTYTSIEDAAAARAHPWLTVPHVLAGVAHDEFSAHQVLNMLADGMAAMMKSETEITGNEMAEKVNAALAVCAVRLWDTAREIGPAPVDMDGF